MTFQRGREGLIDPPYTGLLGATRREFAFVPSADGVPRRVEILRGINAVTDPLLSRQALDGVLHRFGELDLAVPYLYHDPATRRFALVVPLARAHEELVLRAELLTRLAAETAELLPGYVRDARTVMGSAGLRRYLDESLERGAGRASQPPVDPRVESLQQRDDRLHRRAQEVTHREDELHARLEAVDAGHRDLALQQRELEQRLAEILAREESVVEEERVMRASMAALASREAVLVAREEDVTAREEIIARRTESAAALAAEGALSTDALHDDLLHDDPLPDDALHHERVSGDALPDDAMELEPEEQTGRVQLVGTPRTPGPDSDLMELQPEEVAELDLDVGARMSTDDALETVPMEPGEDGAQTTDGNGSGVRNGHGPMGTLETMGGVAPEAGVLGSEGPAMWAARGGRAYAAVVEGEVRVWLLGSSEVAQQVASGGVAPVLQADPDGLLPLALLSVKPQDAEPVCRVVLDLTRPDDRAVLEALARDFRVRVEVVSAAGRALGSYAVGAPCEANAARVMDLLSTRDVGSPEARQAESVQWLEAGLQPGSTGGAGTGGEETRGADLMTPSSEQALSTAAGVAGVLAAYEPLLDRARLDRLTVARGVSAAQIESLGKRLVLAALRTGVPLSEPFVQRAVTLGVAVDARTLASRALTAFARTVEGGVEAIGRTPAEASRAWGPLLAWAESLGATVPEAARAAMAMLFDPDDPTSVAPPDGRTAPVAEAYAGMPDAELVGWIDHAGARLPAARELARRDAARWGAALGSALRLLPTPAAAELAAEIMQGGDAVGDVWVQVLGSPRRATAAIAAVGAGVLRLRRALNPVVQRALARDSGDEWRLFGWAAGEFGPAVVKSVARQEGATVERLAWVLGHAVRCGAGKDLERARTGATSVFLEAATRALALQDEVRAYDDALRRGAGTTEAERVAHVLLGRTQAQEADGTDGSTARLT